MARRRRPSPMFRLRKTKAALLAVGFTLAGILLIMLKAWLEPMKLGDFTWIRSIPFGELGGTLVGAGVLGTLFEYTFRKDQQKATTDQFRQVIREQAPTMRDAVIEGFAINPQDLKRVANPELLDQIASNVMALRLGDEQFAHEIYADIRDQAIRAAERWYDVNVRLRLSTAVERSTEGTPLFDLLVEWEYTTIPSAPVRKFACVSDRAEYEALRVDVPVTSTWFMTTRPGVNASSRDCYELLELTVDGRKQTIRRSAKKTGQTYTAYLDQEARGGNAVRIRQVFRVVTPAYGHRLYFELGQPARGLTLTLDYTDTAVAVMNVTDTVASRENTRVSRNPAGTSGKTITIESPGWLMPKSGYVFTWALESELPRDEQRHEAA